MKITTALLLAVASVSTVTAQNAGSIKHMLQRRDAFVDLTSSVHVARDLPAGEKLPVIDLGYVKQQATSFGTAGDVDYYVFKNVRFAVSNLSQLCVVAVHARVG